MRACWLKWVGRDWSISADYIWLNYSGANIGSIYRHVDGITFASFIAFFMQRKDNLLILIMLGDPFFRVRHAFFRSHLTAVARTFFGQERENLVKDSHVLGTGSRRFVVMKNLSGHRHFRKPILVAFDVPTVTGQGMFSVDVLTDILCVPIARNALLLDNRHFVSPPSMK